MLSPAHPHFQPLQVAWRLPPGLELAFCAVGGSTAVFNSESGDTHLLAPPAAELLGRLATGEVLAGEGLADAAAALEQAGHEASGALRELHALGLVEPFAP